MIKNLKYLEKSWNVFFSIKSVNYINEWHAYKVNAVAIVIGCK